MLLQDFVRERDGAKKDSKLHIVLSFEASLPTICAHELLSWFLKTALSDGGFTRMGGDSILQEPDISESWKNFRLKNSNLTSLAQRVKESGLMNFEYALIHTVTALSHASKLPRAWRVLDYARRRALDFKSRRQFSEAAKVYKWLLLDFKGGSKQTEMRACALSIVFQKQLETIIRIMEEVYTTFTEASLDERLRDAKTAKKMVVEALPEEMASKLERAYELHEGIGGREEKELEQLFPPNSLMPAWLASRICHSLGKTEGLSDYFDWNILHYSVKIDKQVFDRGDLIAKTLFDDPKFDQTLLNKQDMHGRTPLHEAVSRGAEVETIFFIEKGSLIDAQDEEGMTALHVAARNGHHKIANILVSSGAKVHILDVGGKSALHWLCHSADADTETELQSFMGLFKNAIQVRDRDGRTALHLAIALGRSRVFLKQLIEVGCDPNIQGYQGRSPLHVAAERESEDATALLLEMGADVNAKDWDGDTALHRVAFWGDSGLNVAKQLVEKGADVQPKAKLSEWTPLHIASSVGAKKMVDWLLKMQGGINAKGFLGRTPLLLAAASGRLEVLQLLVEKGAPYSKDTEGRTALDLALRGLEEFELLEKEALDSEGRELASARREDYLKVVEWLTAHTT
jgi:ankyrin repeat protein